MAGTNKLYPFADDAGANVVNAATWQSYAQRTVGFQSGIAKSEYCNRAFAQGTNSAYAMGELIRKYTNRTADIDPTTLAAYFEEALTAFGNSVLKPAILGAAFPVGCIYTSTNSANPSTYLGIGTWSAYGAGRVLVGAGGAYAAGSTGGAASLSVTPSGTVGGTTLTVANLPSHTHTATTASAGAHSHTAQSAGSHTHDENNAGSHTHSENSTGAHTHTRGTMEITGWFSADDHMVAALDGKVFKKGTYGGGIGSTGSETGYQMDFVASGNWTGSTSSAGSHKHTIDSAGSHKHTIVSAGAHTHSTDSKGAHTHTITVSSTGSGTAHSHSFTGAAMTISTLQPYVVVYFWRRTA